MSQESSATELEVAMLYSDVLAESDDENDVWLRRLHEGVAVAKAVVAERKAAASGGGASSFGSPSQKEAAEGHHHLKEENTVTGISPQTHQVPTKLRTSRSTSRSEPSAHASMTPEGSQK